MKPLTEEVKDALNHFLILKKKLSIQQNSVGMCNMLSTEAVLQVVIFHKNQLRAYEKWANLRTKIPLEDANLEVNRFVYTPTIDKAEEPTINLSILLRQTLHDRVVQKYRL